MSIIREFYKYYSGVNTAKDFAPIAVEAIEWLYHVYVKHWNTRGATGGPVDWSGMPGQEFGFRPMDVRVIKPKSTETEGGSGEFYYAHLLSGEAGSFMADPDKLIDTYLPRKNGFYLGKKRYKDPISFLGLPEPETDDVYAILPSRGYGSNRYTPMLYNLETGEVYYVHILLNITDGGRLKIQRKDSKSSSQLCPAFCINWITGSKHYVGYPVVSGHERTWALPHQLEEYKEQRISEERSREKWGYVLRKAVLKENPHIATKPDYSAVKPEEEEFLKKEVKNRILERIKPVVLAPDLLVETVTEVEARPVVADRDPETHAILRYQKPSTVTISCGPCITYPFLERLYALEKGALRCAYAIAEMASNSVDGGMATMCSLLGNLFQSALQAKSSWFLSYLAISLRTNFKVSAPIDPTAKTLPAVFGMTRPDFKRLLDKDSPEEFILFAYMNQVKPTSYEVFERSYEKIRIISEELKAEADDPRGTTPTDHSPNWSKGRVQLRTKRGRIIMETRGVPKFIEYYVEKRMQKSNISVYQFLKYIQTELRIARAMSSDPVDLWKLLRLLADYNRMAREIIPSIGFSLPHNTISAHDAMVANYNKILAERAEGSTYDELLKFAKCYAGKTADVLNDERFIVVAPVNSIDLYDEGIILNHCVGSYGSDIMAARGSMLIYFLRNRKAPQRPLVTIQIDKDSDEKYSFTEVAGKGNRLPTSEETEYLERWLIAFNKAIAEEAENRKSARPSIFDGEVLAWLSTMGVDSAHFPPYNGEETHEENYRRLFDVTLPFMIGRGGATESGFTPEALKNQLAVYIGKLRLPKTLMKEAVAIIDGTAVA